MLSYLTEDDARIYTSLYFRGNVLNDQIHLGSASMTTRRHCKNGRNAAALTVMSELPYETKLLATIVENPERAVVKPRFLSHLQMTPQRPDPYIGH